MINPLLQWAVWLAGTLFQLLLLVEAFQSRLFRVYPLFSVFLGWQVLRSVPSMISFRYFPARTYFLVFWFFEVVSWALMFLVIMELFQHSLARYSGLQRLSRTCILCVGTALLVSVAGTLLFAEVVDPQPSHWMNNWLYLMLRSIRMVHAGLLLTLALFLSWFRLKTTFLLRCLILGWLVNSILEFTITSLRSQLGPRVNQQVSLAHAVCFVGILMFWYWAFRRSRSSQQEEGEPVLQLSGGEALVLARLEGINASLVKALQR